MARGGKPGPKGAYADVAYSTAFLTYIGFAMLIIIGYLRDVCGKIFGLKRYRKRPGYGPLLLDYYDFYMRRLYLRIQDCWARPICSRAGAWIDVLEREVHPGYGDGRPVLKLAPGLPPRRCLNLSSYNYLGYAEVPGGVYQKVLDAVDEWGVGTCASVALGGYTRLHRELEELVAQFLQKEDAVVMGMGFATNSQLLPTIVGKGDLILSDELNHASIIVGARSSGAKTRVFLHNRMDSLESELRMAIAEGQESGEPWRKILIVVEGMYSMEGETCRLREIVAIKKKYGVYLYVDEAHSIGALGRTGRGVCEYYGVDTRDVDILMGTFTKSFGAVGGYVASTKALVSCIRRRSSGLLYDVSMSPPCVQHIICVLRQVAGLDGTDIGAEKIRSLRENSIYFREHLRKMGIQTVGDWDSPVIPIMIYIPGRIAAFSRMCYDRGVAVVVVGFPATPLLLGRARICLSAAHTREDLDLALGVINEVSNIIQIRYGRPWLESILPARWLRGAQKSECLSHIPGHESCTTDACEFKAY